MHDDIPVAHRQGQGQSRSPIRWRRWQLLSPVVLAGLFFFWFLIRSMTPPAASLGVPAIPPGQQTTPAVKTTVNTTTPSLLGHLAYKEAPANTLQVVGRYQGRTVMLQQVAASRFVQMTRTAATEGIILIPISGFRSIADQDYLFFQLAQKKSLRPQERALVSAPPGYSEHHTGYAVDIGDGQNPSTDTEISFAETRAFEWLRSHGAQFGFELSFPQGNAQGVSYEPWHWRFVGDRASLETFYGRDP